MGNKKATICYRVYITTTIDRPEYRDASYNPTTPGKRVTHIVTRATAAGAVATYEEILRGEGDFLSEYVSAVEVVRVADDETLHTYRVRVERTEADLVIRLARRTPMLHNLATILRAKGANFTAMSV